MAQDRLLPSPSGRGEEQEAANPDVVYDHEAGAHLSQAA
jgi:hypothetical protein